MPYHVKVHLILVDGVEQARDTITARIVETLDEALSLREHIAETTAQWEQRKPPDDAHVE
ncbi:MAG: hypothetical protein PHC88_05380 [Terrimicrobiaceae bacterium]|nr:hypothetical protein [Terrimicrobiaceae bacterium]